MRHIAEALAWTGCEVRSLCTTGCENGANAEHWLPALAREGRDVHAIGSPGSWLEVHDRCVRHLALITDPFRRHQWVRDHGPVFDRRFEALLRSFAPQIVLTFGSDASDHRRWALARSRGARVVLLPHNLRQAGFARPEIDAVWVPSRFLAGRYALAWGTQSPITVLPTPLRPAFSSPASPGPERVFVTFVNPEPAKGSSVVAGVVQRWLSRRPQQPVLIVEGRAGVAEWLSALSARNVPAAQCAQVFVSPTRADLSGVWGASRLVLMPSLVEESAGRVALEAMRHGVVPVVSDRGALGETVVEPGWVEPVPSSLNWQAREPADDETCARWDRAISAWLDDPEAWRAASSRAVDIAMRHDMEQVAPRYRQALDSLLLGL